MDVLVVGGGPVGLTLASELLRHGVDCRIVEQKEEREPWSKAAGVQARTMEVFEDMGIVDRVLARGRPMYGANIYAGTRRVAHLDIEIAHTSYPYVFGISQRETEAVLEDHLGELDGSLERQTLLEGFEQDDEGVTAALSGPDGATERVRARWLVGCDGARSTVRKTLGLAFEGSTFEQTLIQADVGVRFPFEVDPHEAVMFVSDDGPVGALPLLGEGRYRLICLDVDDPPEEPPLSMYEEILRRRAPEGVELVDPDWTVSFRFHGRLAERYRVGRTFIAGDAAHIHSPVGAQGMNMGIQDAYNLAWKLGLVARDAAHASILDSYEVERRPVAESVVSGTDRATKNAMRMMTLRSPVAQALRNQAVSLVVGTGVVQHGLFQRIGGLTIEYGASPIVGEQHSSIWGAQVGPGRPDERPKLGDWLRFSHGPGPGGRVADAPLPPGSGAETLFGLLRGTAHHLLLFDGAAPTEAGYEAFDRIAATVSERYGDRIVVHVVVPRAEKPAALSFDGSLVLDAEADLHAHFGCGSEGLYLVRPDGYVAFRAQPADGEALQLYLASIFG